MPINSSDSKNDPIPRAHWNMIHVEESPIARLQCSRCGYISPSPILEHSCTSCGAVMRYPGDGLTGDPKNERG